MTITEFKKAYWPHAVAVEKKTGIPAYAILAQAGLESAWGKAAPGNMFFGVKDTDGINGNEQLLITTEYSRSSTLKFPVIISVTPVVRNGQKWFKYKIKDYFRKYDSAADSFEDHAHFFIRNKRYAKALAVAARTDIEGVQKAKLFISEVAKAGYATDPDYATKLNKIIDNLAKD